MLDDAASQLSALTRKYEQLTGNDASTSSRRHDAGNALSAARASLEAIADGVLEPTPERLANIHRSLETARNLLS